MTAGIYTITVEGMGVYYGESANIEKRWAKHRRQLHSGVHHCYKLRRLYRELGPGAFKYAILEVIPDRNLRKLREASLIIMNPDTCLNTKGSLAECITRLRMPNKDVYRNTTLHLERQHRGDFVKVRQGSKQGRVLGVECVEGKFKLGLFWTDQNCALYRVTPNAKAN